MNWGDIGKIIKPLAPILGTALGGPLGGIAGSILGAALGLGSGDGQSPITPENVGKAIEQGGATVQAAIQSAEADATARWAYLTEGLKDDAAQGQAINETMRAEIASGVSWWHWRHLLGYSVVAWTFAPLPIVTFALIRANAPEINLVIALAAALLPYFTIIAALLGYVAADTTRRITTAMVGEHAPSILGVITKAVTKK